SGSSPSRSGFDSASKRSLSAASEALEMSSRRKISLWLYREWIISLRSCFTSAWKSRVSRSRTVAIRLHLGEFAGGEFWGRSARCQDVQPGRHRGCLEGENLELAKD